MEWNSDPKIMHQKYKAIHRRKGAYRNKSGRSFEWNDALIAPLIKAMSSGWGYAFSQGRTAFLESFVKNGTAAILRIQTML